MYNRFFLIGTIALATSLAACAGTHRQGEPEPAIKVSSAPAEDHDLTSEVELRAFLQAEVEERIADMEADAIIAHIAEGEGSVEPPFDQADFDLPITMNERVEFWMEYFLERSRDRFEIYLTRMGQYEEMIRKELRAREMPEDLIYLALIESGFSPTAISSAAAVGVWQFIAPTATRYQLEVSRYVDERRDPVRATRAALEYLGELHDRFGSWYLAAAGYNTGENRVERLLRERAGGARGADSLFWEISAYLPSETRNYVPKMIAATILGRYREYYGFNDLVPAEPIPFEVVTVPDATELAVIARAAGVDKESIENLNPHFLRGVTPPGREVEVRIPVGRSEAFQVAYAQIPPNQRVTRIEHLVRRGETLSHIARRYGTSVAAIQETNGIRNPNSLRAGRTIIIAYGGVPVQPQTTAARSRAATTLPRGTRTSNSVITNATITATPGVTNYQVRRGDSLWSIARQHGVTVQDLKSWNGLGTSNKIIPGQELKVARADEVIVYRIQPGDTIWDIARRHGITTDHLLQWNSLAADATIRPGEELEVPVIR